MAQHKAKRSACEVQLSYLITFTVQNDCKIDIRVSSRDFTQLRTLRVRLQQLVSEEPFRTHKQILFWQTCSDAQFPGYQHTLLWHKICCPTRHVAVESFWRTRRRAMTGNLEHKQQRHDHKYTSRKSVYALR